MKPHEARNKPPYQRHLWKRKHRGWLTGKQLRKLMAACRRQNKPPHLLTGKSGRHWRTQLKRAEERLR